jgi:hypothetical protein
MNLKSTIIVVLVIVLGVFIWSQFFGNSFNLPKGEPDEVETIIIGDVESPNSTEKIEIMITDGVKHSIPLDELLSGGVGKDGIPPIDSPIFISQTEANEWLEDDEPGVAFSRGNTHRFYPFKVLVRHEIVNDTVEGQRTLITYCPLCLTGFVFDPVVQGERVEFGVSGMLWKSNLVMYDRKTDSLWPQVLGQAVVGEMTGTMLTTLPSDQMLYGNWKKQFPNGEVLSKEPGRPSFTYDGNPYGGYYVVTKLSRSLVGEIDDRLPPESFIFGIVRNGKSKAYDEKSIKEKGEVTDTFEGKTFVLRHNKELDVVRMFEKTEAGAEKRINPFSSFWFSWAAAHPNTELYK